MKWFAAMLLAVSVVACGNGDHENTVTTPVQQISFVGTWKLQTVNGKALPYILDQIGEDKLELMEAGLVATSTGAFTSTSVERTTISGQTESRSFSEGGNYALSGGDVSLTFASDGAVVVGRIAGDSLTFAGGGVPVVYRRQ